MTEYIVQIEDSEKNMSERFVGQLRSYPELIRCKDCALRDTDGCQIRMSMYGLKDDDFCSYGDRGKTE